MRSNPIRPFLLPLLAALAGCGQAPEQPEANVAVPAPAPVASPAPAPSPSPAARSRYIGEYPTEAVAGGTSFLADPAVRRAVTAAVPDAAVRALVLGSEVTAVPIVAAEGRVLAYGCEPHNCGPHNWAIAITPDGTRAAICHYDASRRIARWYPDRAGPDPATGCPAGD